MSHCHESQRRDFLRLSALAGSGLLLGVQSEHAFAQSQNLSTANEVSNASAVSALTPFIHIASSGAITIFNPRPDMGQGSFQALPAIIAEELCVPFASIIIKQTEGEAKFGGQNAGGSGSVRGLWKPLRTAGAAAREMLMSAAAAAWNVPASECVAENAMVIHKPNGQPSGKKLSYGELAEAAGKLPVPTNPTLKDPSQFTIIGKAIPRPDIPQKVNGTAVFGVDARLPGMLYASIEHSPVLHGKVLRYNERAAKKVKGVKYVVKSERPLFSRVFEGVAVLADSYAAALQGRKALMVEWDETGFNTLNTDELYQSMRTAVQSQSGVSSAGSRGNAAEQFSKAASNELSILEAQYETPYLAHAPMEPEAVIADYHDGRIEVWTSTQGAPWTIGAIARHLNIPKETIAVHPLFLGGSFGRKAGVDDFVLEAVLLSKKVGAPVKLIWTREDDITQGPFRTGMVSALKAGFDAQGKLVALQHKYAVQSIQSQFKSPSKGANNGSLEEQSANTAPTFDDWTGEGLVPEDSPYGVPNLDIRFVPVQTQIPVMWWRSVYPSTSVFGHESFIDEIAHRLGQDPLAFRLALLEKAHETERTTAMRFRAVLNTLAEKSAWNTSLPSGKGRGMAVSRSFASICAHAVTVGRAGDGALRVEKVVSVMDCGTYVNPDNVRAQIEGCIVMGLTAALKPPITFKNGRAEQSNFDTYQLLRINEMPEIDIHLMTNGEPPGGVGEPSLPPVAPALANAVFAATGKRLRSLPLNLSSV
jgi:isoquinoline 1-oxidoreductase beta subunit